MQNGLSLDTKHPSTASLTKVKCKSGDLKVKCLPCRIRSFKAILRNFAVAGEKLNSTPSKTIKRLCRNPTYGGAVE